MMPLAVLLKFASTISGYSIPDNIPPPKLVELTHAQMVHDACHNREPCEVYGRYKDKEVIYVDKQAIEEDQIVSEDSVIVHELTHWLQQHHNHGGFTCLQRNTREEEAYHVQQLFIMDVEHKTRVLIYVEHNC